MLPPRISLCDSSDRVSLPFDYINYQQRAIHSQPHYSLIPIHLVPDTVLSEIKPKISELEHFVLKLRKQICECITSLNVHLLMN